MEKMDVATAFKMLEESVKGSVDSSDREVSIEVGEVSRQGDIYVHRVSTDHSHGEQTADTQLALGSSQGSRHVAVGSGVKVFKGTTVPKGVSSETFLGPFIEASEAFVIEHPEHANFKMQPGCYQVTHQMDIITRKRVQD